MVLLLPLLPDHLCFREIHNYLSLWYLPTRVVWGTKAFKRLLVLLSMYAVKYEHQLAFINAV